jgi:hypothetical protein
VDKTSIWYIFLYVGVNRTTLAPNTSLAGMQGISSSASQRLLVLTFVIISPTFIILSLWRHMIISFETRVTTYHRDHHVTTTYTEFIKQIYINGNFHVTDQTSTATDQQYSYASHIAWTYHVRRLSWRWYLSSVGNKRNCYPAVSLCQDYTKLPVRGTLSVSEKIIR